MIEKGALGISSLTWVEQPYATAVRRAKEIGFAGLDLALVQGWTEFGVIDLCENDLELTGRLCRLIEDNQMSVLSINTRLVTDSSAFGLTRQAHALCRLAAALHCTSGVTISAGPIRDTFKHICDYLEPIYSAFVDMGVVLMVETHKDDYTERPHNCKQLVQEFPELKLTLDASHFIAQGYEPGDWASLIEYTAHCHIRSCGGNGWNNIQVPADRCCAELYKSLEDMQQAGYGGTYTLEMVEGIGVSDAVSETLRLRDSIRAWRYQDRWR